MSGGRRAARRPADRDRRAHPAVRAVGRRAAADRRRRRAVAGPAPRSTRSPSPPGAWPPERVVLLVSARGTCRLLGFERDFPQLLLDPLPLPDAGRLLDAQPHPPRGRAREQVLAQAAGNPLALIELSKMIAADPDAGRRWATELLPLTRQLTAIMAARYAALPGPARAALLLAAAADSPDLTAAAVPGLTRRPRPRGSGRADPDRRRRAAVHPSARPIGGLLQRPVRRACRRAPDRSRTASATGLIVTRGTWRPPRWDRTSTSPRCWRTAPP